PFSPFLFYLSLTSTIGWVTSISAGFHHGSNFLDGLGTSKEFRHTTNSGAELLFRNPGPIVIDKLANLVGRFRVVLLIESGEEITAQLSFALGSSHLREFSD